MALSEAEIWHNPSCSKSRAVLRLIEECGLAPTIRHYLTDPPDTVELRAMLAALALPAAALLRPEGKSLKDRSESEIIAAMATDPKLIERPVVRLGSRAVIARPPDKVAQLLDTG